MSSSNGGALGLLARVGLSVRSGAYWVAEKSGCSTRRGSAAPAGLPTSSSASRATRVATLKQPPLKQPLLSDVDGSLNGDGENGNGLSLHGLNGAVNGNGRPKEEAAERPMTVPYGYPRYTPKEVVDSMDEVVTSMKVRCSPKYVGVGFAGIAGGVVGVTYFIAARNLKPVQMLLDDKYAWPLGYVAIGAATFSNFALTVYFLVLGAFLGMCQFWPGYFRGYEGNLSKVGASLLFLAQLGLWFVALENAAPAIFAALENPDEAPEMKAAVFASTLPMAALNYASVRNVLHVLWIAMQAGLIRLVNYCADKERSELVKHVGGSISAWERYQAFKEEFELRRSVQEGLNGLAARLSDLTLPTKRTIVQDVLAPIMTAKRSYRTADDEAGIFRGLVRISPPSAAKSELSTQSRGEGIGANVPLSIAFSGMSVWYVLAQLGSMVFGAKEVLGKIFSPAVFFSVGFVSGLVALARYAYLRRVLLKEALPQAKKAKILAIFAGLAALCSPAGGVSGAETGMQKAADPSVRLYFLKHLMDAISGNEEVKALALLIAAVVTVIVNFPANMRLLKKLQDLYSHYWQLVYGHGVSQEEREEKWINFVISRLVKDLQAAAAAIFYSRFNSQEVEALSLALTAGRGGMQVDDEENGDADEDASPSNGLLRARESSYQQRAVRQPIAKVFLGPYSSSGVVTAFLKEFEGASANGDASATASRDDRKDNDRNHLGMATAAPLFGV